VVIVEFVLEQKGCKRFPRKLLKEPGQVGGSRKRDVGHSRRCDGYASDHQHQQDGEHKNVTEMP